MSLAAVPIPARNTVFSFLISSQLPCTCEWNSLHDEDALPCHLPPMSSRDSGKFAAMSDARGLAGPLRLGLVAMRTIETNQPTEASRKNEPFTSGANQVIRPVEGSHVMFTGTFSRIS